MPRQDSPRTRITGLAEIMSGGLLATFVAALACVVLGFGFGGVEPGLSALTGSVLVLAFFEVGGLIEAKLVARADVQGLLATVFGFVVRVGLLVAALATLERFGGAWVHKTWVFVALVSCVTAWMVGVVWAAKSQRVAVYDVGCRVPQADESER